MSEEQVQENQEQQTEQPVQQPTQPQIDPNEYQRLVEQNRELEEKANRWYQEANTYHQRVQELQAQGQSQQQAQQQASNEGFDPNDDGFVERGDLAKFKQQILNEMKGLVGESLKGTIGQFQQQSQEQQAHNAAAEIVKNNFQPYNPNMSEQDFTEKVRKQAMVNMAINRNTYGYDLARAYEEAVVDFGQPKVNPGNPNQTPSVKPNPGMTGYGGGAIPSAPTGLDAEISKAKQEMEKAQSALKADSSNQYKQLEADKAIDAYYAALNKKKE